MFTQKSSKSNSKQRVERMRCMIGIDDYKNIEDRLGLTLEEDCAVFVKASPVCTSKAFDVLQIVLSMRFHS